MIPIFENIYIAPNFSYYFERENYEESYLYKDNIKTTGILYGLDIHYAFHLRQSKSFISPLVGVYGASSWNKVSLSSLTFDSERHGNEYQWVYSYSDFSTSNVVGNLGIAGKWFVDNNIFINTEVKYFFDFKYFDHGAFHFLAGIGYAF